MSDTETPPPDGGQPPKRGPGRPRNPNLPPTRAAGRHGQIWDDCVVRAANDGQTMTAFVAEAITRELARRERADRTARANAAVEGPRFPNAVADCGDNTDAHAPHTGCRGTLPGTAPVDLADGFNQTADDVPEQPVCERCGQEFDTAAQLEAHEAAHEEQAGEQP